MIIPQDKFRTAFKQLPYTIRDYITDDQLAVVTEGIGRTYNLHVDAVGALYRETTNMLLGLESPEQFMAELKKIGIPQTTATEIVHELNQKVFVPLREKMKNGGDHDPYEENEEIEKELYENTETKKPVLPTGSRPVGTPAPATSVPSAPSMPTPASADQTTFKMKPFVPPTGTAPFPSPAPAVPAVQPAPVAPAQTGPTSFIRTMSEDVEAVQHHQMPQMHQFSHANQGTPAQMPVRPQMPPTPAAVPMPAPIQAPASVRPSAPMPQAAAPFPTPIYSAPAPTPAPAPARAIPPAQQMPQRQFAPPPQPVRSFPAPVRLDTHENIVRDYTHDPYREPIDDN